MPSRDGPVIIVSHPEKSVANMISLTLRGSGFEAIAVEPQDGQGLVELVLTTGQQIQQIGRRLDLILTPDHEHFPCLKSVRDRHAPQARIVVTTDNQLAFNP